MNVKCNKCYLWMWNVINVTYELWNVINVTYELWNAINVRKKYSVMIVNVK